MSNRYSRGKPGCCQKGVRKAQPAIKVLPQNANQMSQVAAPLRGELSPSPNMPLGPTDASEPGIGAQTATSAWIAATAALRLPVRAAFVVAVGAGRRMPRRGIGSTV